MCYGTLLDGDATTTSVRSALRAERRTAVLNGLAAAALVFGLLALRGTPPAILLGTSAAAVPLAYLLHQVVMVAGIGLVRARAKSS